MRSFIICASATFILLCFTILSSEDVAVITKAFSSSVENTHTKIGKTPTPSRDDNNILEERSVPTIIPFAEEQIFELPISMHPTQAHIDVPFSSQAPTGDWSMPFQEACEEMSLLMVQSYLQNQTIEADAAETFIHKFTQWQEQHGYGESMTLEQTARVAREYLNLQTSIIESPTIHDIETLIAEGKPVIIPAAGRMLQNPYFTDGGPWYHMLVVTGYTDSQFITNDPGTKYGEGYAYKKELLMQALHDWTGRGEDILLGKKRILIVHQ